jgi:hypothetical protein
MHDLHAPVPTYTICPGERRGRIAEFFAEMRRLGQRPTLIGLEYSYDWYESLPKIEQCIRFFNQVTRE